MTEKPKSENVTPQPEVGKKHWHRPALRKLPISQTAGGGTFNEGGGKGKGDAGPNPVS